MTLWGILLAMTVIAVLLIILPVWRKKQNVQDRQSYDLTIYRDQLKEVERDLARGVLGEAEAEAARTEISRRMLKVDAERSKAVNPLSTGFIRVTGLSAAVLIAVGSFLFYLGQGDPSAPEKLAGFDQQRQQVAEQDLEMNKMVSGLEDKLKADPGSLDNWILLARSYAMMQNYPKAVAAWSEAIALAPEETSLVSAYAEALIFANEGQITPRARQALERVVAASPDDPRAQYYIGLADVQSGQLEGGVARWVELVRRSPADAPWRQMVVDAIADVAPNAGIDMAGIADLVKVPTPDELAQQLAENPKDWQGWMRLIDEYARAGRREDALKALASAKEAFKGAPFVLQQFDDLAGGLGLVDIASTLQPPRPSGQLGNPTADDIKAAEAMSSEDRQAMILSMVEGLAEKLEDDPNNLEGWLRLMRSYSVLGQKDMAQQAFEKAKVAFNGDSMATSQIVQTANVLGLN